MSNPNCIPELFPATEASAMVERFEAERAAKAEEAAKVFVGGLAPSIRSAASNGHNRISFELPAYLSAEEVVKKLEKSGYRVERLETRYYGLGRFEVTWPRTTK